MIDWRQRFEDEYTSPGWGVQERVMRTVFGDDYPEGVEPYSFVSLAELHRFARDLALERGGTLVDLGCGRGGAGLWVALETGARLVGIDIAEAALVAARGRAARLGADATFVRGEFEATGLADGAADAVMSVDALLFTPDKAAALRELRRVLRPGRRLCLTSWDYHTQPVGRPPQVADHRPHAEAAGFRVISYDETRRWRERQEATGAGLLAAADELAAEAGEPVEVVKAGIEEMNATTATMIRRFFLVAEAA